MNFHPGVLYKKEKYQTALENCRHRENYGTATQSMSEINMLYCTSTSPRKKKAAMPNVTLIGYNAGSYTNTFHEILKAATGTL